MLRGLDDLPAAGERQRRPGVAVVKVLELADERARNDEPDVPEHVAHLSVEIDSYLERHEQRVRVEDDGLHGFTGPRRRTR